MKKRLVSAMLAGAMCIQSVYAGTCLTANAMEDYTLPDDWEFVFGDCNGDYEFNILDIVVLKKWLMNVPGAEIPLLPMADVNFDRRVNVFDLCIMEQELLDSMTTYSSAKFMSEDEVYTMYFSIRTDYRKHSEISVTWYDPDGDREKTDSFEVTYGNPFAETGEWENSNTFSSSSYKIIWKENSVSISFVNTKDGDTDEIELEYPDRTKSQQSYTTEIQAPESPVITSADITAECYGKITDKAFVKKSGNVLSQGTVGKVGTALTVDIDNSIEEYTVTLHYNEDELRWVPEKNLVVLAYDKNAPIQIFIPVPDIIRDEENNTITFKGDRDCEFILADGYKWASGGNNSEYVYASKDIDITEYISDWERTGQTGDIMALADKQWAKSNLIGSKFLVGTAEELASAVYYINARMSLDYICNSERISIELTDDIDLAGFSWAPIDEFTGELIGNGHVINNMNLSGNFSGYGFINKAQAEYIHDVTFENASITAKSNKNVGIIAAECSLPGSTDFKNVHATGTMNISSNSNYGGLVGGNGYSKFTDCTAEVIINGSEVCTYLCSAERISASQLENSEDRVELSLDADSMTVTRTSDPDITDYSIVIMRNGKTVLTRGFSKSEILDLHVIEEIALAEGEYKLYVTAYMNGGYKRISNIIEYTI